MFSPIGEFSLLSGVSGSKFSPRLNALNLGRFLFY
jgi:hypothetical protein